MKFSIVVVTYNRRYMLEDCLKYIRISLKYLPSYEIFVVNNNSTDSTRLLLNEYAKEMPNFNVITMDQNMRAIARNKALEKAQGDYIVQIDDDTLVKSNWVEEVMPHFTEGVGAVGPLGMVFHNWHEFFTVVHMPPGSYVDGLVGYFWVFKNEGWRYDESFQIYMEEQDLQLKMRYDKKYRFKACHMSAAKHLQAGQKNMELEVRNSKKMVDKWQPVTKELNFEYAKI